MLQSQPRLRNHSFSGAFPLCHIVVNITVKLPGALEWARLDVGLTDYKLRLISWLRPLAFKCFSPGDHSKADREVVCSFSSVRFCLV